MLIAISTDGSNVSAHFGRCPVFTIVNIDNGKIISTQKIENPGHNPGFLPRFLHEKGVRCIIAGGMGQRASGLFAEQGIETILGVSGLISDVVESIANGTLEGGESLCMPGAGKGYGLDKTECDHSDSDDH